MHGDCTTCLWLRVCAARQALHVWPVCAAPFEHEVDRVRALGYSGRVAKSAPPPTPTHTKSGRPIRRPGPRRQYAPVTCMHCSSGDTAAKGRVWPTGDLRFRCNVCRQYTRVPWAEVVRLDAADAVTATQDDVNAAAARGFGESERSVR